MKRVLAILLSLVMVLSMTTTVWAEEPTTAHMHDSEWQEFVSQGGDLAAGNYYLVRDSVLTSTLNIKGETKICLNGYALSLQDGATGSVISHTSSNTTLTVCDCSDHTNKHYFTVGEDGLWTMTATETAATKTVYGGVITGGSATNGGGINASKSVSLDGIAVVGNRSTGTNGNGTQGGGGVFVYNGNGPLLKMTNCKIYGNTAVYGGGLHTRINTSSTYDNVEIKYNTASTQKSGVYFYSGCTMTNCTVTDNTKTDGSDDKTELFLREGPYTLSGTFGNIQVEGFSYSGTTPITINGVVNGTVTVGLSSYSRNDAVNQVTINAEVKKDIVVQEGDGVSRTSNTAVTITGNVSGNVDLGGTNRMSVEVASTAKITGNMTISGGSATISGSVGSVSVTGGIVRKNNPNVTVNGPYFVQDNLIMNSNTTTATIPNDIIEAVKTMNFTVNGVKMDFDGAATYAVRKDVSTYDLVVEVKKIPDGLTEAQSAYMVGKDVAEVYEITLKANGVPVYTKDSGGGTLTVTIPYTKSAADSNIEMYWVAGTDTSKVDSTYDGDNVVAKLSHLSTYAIVEVKAPVTPTPTPNTPSSGGAYMSEGHTVTSPFTGVDKVYVDGALVKPENYTTYGGNIILSQKYLDGLKAGTHTVKIVFGERQATGTFTTKGTGTVQSAKTFDAGVAVYGMMAVASACGAAYVTGKKR